MLNDYTLLQFMDDGDGWDFNMNDFTWGEYIMQQVCYIILFLVTVSIITFIEKIGKI